MRKLLMSTCLSAFMLAGCATTAGTSTITQIQAATVAACAFLPTAIQIASLFPGVDVYVGTAAAVATQICAVVQAQNPPLTRRRLAVHHTPISAAIIMPDGRQAIVNGYFVK